MAAEVIAMKLPPSFPDQTLFVSVGGTPVTFGIDDGRCLSWEDREAAEPSPFPLDDMARNGNEVSEAEFRALVHHCHTCALPALLVRAAEDLQRRRRIHAELKAQGLSDVEIGARMRPWRIRLHDDDAETIALRAVAAARQSSRRA
jgi:hypothetical protein